MPEQSQTAEMAGAEPVAGAFRAWSLPPGPRAAAVARSIARSVLGELGLPSAAVRDAQTVISELATNAVVHGDRERAEVWAQLGRHPSLRLTFEVFDAGPWRGPGAAGPADTEALLGGGPSDACGGRGLLLVNALAEEAGGRWGVRPARARLGPSPVSGKAVYFTLPLPEGAAAVLAAPAPGPVPPWDLC